MDKLEKLACERALALYKLDPEEWGVSVRVLSGCLANMIAYSAVLDPGDVALGMHFTEGGHLTHGLRFGDEIVSHSAKFYHWEHYGVDKDGWIDYDQMDQVFF